MSSPVIASHALVVNPEAHAQHDIGLRAELRGDYDTARLNYAQGRVIMSHLPRTLDTVVQTARIMRDEGFCDVRDGIDNDEPDIIAAGRKRLERSVHITSPLADRYAPVRPERERTDLSADVVHREVMAEHGATISLLGRVSTVQAVITDTDLRTNTDESVALASSAKTYQKAHEALQQGNNGYYRVSNAMVAARHERLAGRALETFSWLGRAAASMAWTVFKDRGNTKAAAKTLVGRALHLRSYDVARESVLKKP